MCGLSPVRSAIASVEAACYAAPLDLHLSSPNGGELLCRLGGDPDRAAGLDRVEQRTADPPDGVGGELQAAPIIEPFDRSDQTDGPLLDQVLELNATPAITLGDREHQPQVAFDHLLLGMHITALDALGQTGLLGGAQRRRTSDPAHGASGARLASTPEIDDDGLFQARSHAHLHLTRPRTVRVAIPARGVWRGLRRFG